MTRDPDPDLLIGAAAAFGIACVGLLGMAFLVLFGGPDGATAVQAIAGLGLAKAGAALRWAAACDTLLPIGYGAGFSLLALATAETRMAFAVVLVTVLGLVADFAENGLVLAELSGAAIATTAKFGLLAIAGILTTAFLPSDRLLFRAAKLAGWGLIPLLLAAIAAKIPLALDPLGFAIGLCLVFAVLGWICLELRR